MGMRRLTLLRHGQAEPVDACPEDFERALTKRGGIEAHEIAARLLQRDLVPDLILVSPADRAWATAEIIAAHCDLDDKQLLGARELYLATPETTWRILTLNAGNLSHVMICGHNPGLSQVASRFGPQPQGRELPTAGLATALWHNAEWANLLPESAARCDLDDPESAYSPWTP
jgi:phosphohistidine phosphatase